VIDYKPKLTIITDNVITVNNIGPSSVSSELTPYKSGISFSDAGSAVTIDGVSPAVSSGAIPKSITKLIIGDGQTSPRYLNGHIKSIKYYPRRLTNAQLQELTS
jgi:hypothetical protein